MRSLISAHPIDDGSLFWEWVSVVGASAPRIGVSGLKMLSDHR